MTIQIYYCYYFRLSEIQLSVYIPSAKRQNTRTQMHSHAMPCHPSTLNLIIKSFDRISANRNYVDFLRINALWCWPKTFEWTFTMCVSVVNDRRWEKCSVMCVVCTICFPFNSMDVVCEDRFLQNWTNSVDRYLWVIAYKASKKEIMSNRGENTHWHKYPMEFMR